MSISSSLLQISNHIGLITLINAPRDVHLVISMRCVRLCAFGALSLIIVQYLKTKNINEAEIGILLTLTIVGDLIFSFLLTLISDSLGRRRILILSSFIMSLTGIALYYARNLYLIALIMILGIVTPSGGEVGPFRSIEQSVISTLCRYEDRSDIFSWYTFSGGVANGAGNLIIGYLINKESDITLCFTLYSIIGAIMLLISLFLSDAIEAHNDITLKQQQQQQQELLTESNSETSSLLNNSREPSPELVTEKKRIIDYLLPNFSAKSMTTLLVLTFLICLDSLGLSLSSKSWTSYYFKTRYDLSPDTLGLIFGSAAFIGAISALAGTFFCKKYGPIKTMIISHSTASLLLSLQALPVGVHELSTLFLIRSFVRTMDLPSKHVFISTTVQPHERTTAIGFINGCKTLINTIGPIVSGYLASKQRLWLSFLIAGLMRLSYDLGLFIRFWGHKM